MKLLRVRMMKPYLCLMGGGSGVFCEQVIQGGAGGGGSRISRGGGRRCDDLDIPPPTPPAAGSAGTGGRSAGNKRIKLIKPNGVVALYDRPIRASKLMEEYPKHRVCRSDSFYIGQKIPHLSDQDKLQKGHTYFLLPSHLFHSVLSFVTIASFASQPLPPQPSTSTTQPPPTAPSVLGAADSNINDSSVTASLRIKREEEQQQMKSRAAILKKAAGASRMSSSSSPPAFDIQKTKSGTLRIRVSEVFISQLIMDQQRDYEKEEAAELEKEEEKKKRLLCTTPQLHKDYKQLVMGSRVRHWKPKLDMISEASTTTININASNKQKRKALLSSASFGIRRNKKSSSSTTTTTTTTTTTGGSCKITTKTCKKSSSSSSNQTSSDDDDDNEQQKQQPQPTIDHGKSDDHQKELVQVVPSSKPSSTTKVPPTACKCKLRRFKLKLGGLTTTTTSNGTSRTSSPAIVLASSDRAVQKIVV